jgi:hypothetical protein
MKFSCIPPQLELGKAWHGLNKNQGAIGEHDEQYQIQAKNRMSFSLKHKRWYPPLQLSQNNI